MEPISPFRITDMIRATISVNTLEAIGDHDHDCKPNCDLIEAYQILNTGFNRSI